MLDGDVVATAQTSRPVGSDSQRKGAFLSAADFAALMDELDSLRRLAAHSGSAPADIVADEAAVTAGARDLLAALEEAGVDPARVQQVATLIELASVLDGVRTVNGGAGVGSIIRVADRFGRTLDYELVASPEETGAPEKVALGSRVGQALLGARPGDRVGITLGNGRRRRVRVLTVQPRALGSLRATLVDAPGTA
jgi:transcription elongation GreA/GreB family factor